MNVSQVVLLESWNHQKLVSTCVYPVFTQATEELNAVMLNNLKYRNLRPSPLAVNGSIQMILVIEMRRQSEASRYPIEELVGMPLRSDSWKRIVCTSTTGGD